MQELDRKNFDAEVLEAEGTILVDYYGTGCVPCAALKPHVEKLAEEFGDKIKFCALNTTSARRVAIGQQIMGLPVIAIYQNGKKVEELVKEAATPEAVAELVKKYAE